MNKDEFLVLDIETAGGNWSQFPVGFDLLFTGIRTQSLYSFYGSDPRTVSTLADTLCSYQGTIVTFNGTKFDLPLLDYFFKKTLNRSLQILNHYDIFAEIKNQSGYPISLDRLSKYTFGSSKLEWDHKKNYETWNNQPQLMVNYNKNDLDLTHELYVRIKQELPLFLDNSTVILKSPDTSVNGFNQGP